MGSEEKSASLSSPDWLVSALSICTCQSREWTRKAAAEKQMKYSLDLNSDAELPFLVQNLDLFQFLTYALRKYFLVRNIPAGSTLRLRLSSGSAKNRVA
jgi:hypothetical protein